MANKQAQEAQNPLILRCNRLVEAFAKSDDERDFYLDRSEGFILYVDLDKLEEELLGLEKELAKNKERYCMIPKLTFYETKKIMEGFVNEKVYDIDTKEKLLDIIQSKEAREHFLDFIYDHHSELEKWQTYYQERSRIRIIEWLRNNHFHFVFEEDLDLPKLMIEKLKKELFQAKVGKDILAARKTLSAKAKTYYSNEALNPRPKRGRPPKQTLKTEIEPQISTDIYTTVPPSLRNFLFIPDLSSTTSTFSSRFGNEDELFNRRSSGLLGDSENSPDGLNQKLAALRSLSNKWYESENHKPGTPSKVQNQNSFDSFDDDEDDDDDDDDDDDFGSKAKPKSKKLKNDKSKAKGSSASGSSKKPAAPSKSGKTAKPAAKKPTKPQKSSAKTKPKAASKAKPPAKEPAAPKKKPLRSIMKLKRKAK